MSLAQKYGLFSDENGGFTVTRPDTPRAFDNFLWNDAVQSCVQQTGVGYCDIQPGDQEAIQVYTGIGRICDIEAFGRDHLMSRLIYIRDDDTGAFWNVGWEPVRAPYTSYACEHGPGYTCIRSETDGIRTALLLVVPPGDAPLEQWRLEVENRSGRPRNCSLFAYNQYALGYQWGFESYGDMLYRGAWYEPDLNGMVIQKHPYIAPHPHLTAFFAADEEPVGYDGSRRFFVGDYATLAAPDAVVKGSCTNTPGSCEATIAALHFRMALPDGASSHREFVSGLSTGVDAAKQWTDRYLGQARESLGQVQAAARQRAARQSVTTPDPQFNRLINIWLKQQTLFGATWCRWGYRGYRDIVQHGMGTTYTEPERTRSILLTALAHMKSDGIALRGWNPVDTKPYSDSTLWLVYTLTAYLKETGDFALLTENVPYYDGGQDTVLAHIEKAMQTLETNKGAHGLCLIRFGDWNDSLTNIGREGRGESVWLTMAYRYALTQLAELYAHLGDTTKGADADRRAEALRTAIRDTCWDGNWFVRCFDDRGEPVGSHRNTEGKIYLNAQSWALIAQIADASQQETLQAACREHLFTPCGYRLLAPPYLERNDHIGRISYLEPGICENGTVYSHVNAFWFLAQLMSGRSEEAYETFRLLSPGYTSGDPTDPKEQIPPYIYANAYYAPEHRNNPLQAEFTWITGSVAWWMHAIMEYQLGVRRTYDGLIIDPVLPADWAEVTLNRTFRDRTFTIEIRRTGEKSWTLNGQAHPGSFIPLSACAATNEVKVTW